VTTGDGFDSTGAALRADGGTGGLDGLTRVATPVDRQVKVLADYLRKRVRSAVMVVDRKATDLYSRSLATDFHARFKDALKAGGRLDEPLTADSPDQPGIKNRYATVANNLNLCGGDPPDVVLYAGRTIFLSGLIGYLETCEKAPITIVTGSDAEGMTGFPGGGRVSVLYTPLADPDQLRKSGYAGYAAFVADARAYYPGFAEADLRDAWALMAHDAVLTAAQAVRLARGGEVPSSSDVKSLLYNLHESNPVRGASGIVEMDPAGDPYHPVVNVIRLSADGGRRLLHTARL
jgi:ABC-type branched-subunit amino acid transport system substrate-binding protein